VAVRVAGVSVLQSAASAKNNSVRAEWLGQSGRTPSELSEKLRWQKVTPRQAPIRHIALNIAPQSQFRGFFSLCRYSIVNGHFGVVANCDHKHKAFRLSYLSLLQSQDSLPYNMA